MREVAVFIPGILGSAIAYDQSGARRPIWDENALGNYRRLLTTPDLFKYSPSTHAIPTGIIRAFRMSGWQIPGARVYERILTFLRTHAAFREPRGSVLEFPYDWRESAGVTANKLGTSLGGELGVDLAHPVDATRLTIVTHSMGALSARLAIAENRIHPDNVRQLIHLAPPLLGAPAAFRTAYHRPVLPMFNVFAKLFWLAPTNRDLALRILRDALLGCPSLFELMPPKSAPFWVENGDLVSPFDAPFVGGLPLVAAVAAETHLRLADATKRLRERSVRVTIIRGRCASVRTDGWYRASLVGSGDGSGGMSVQVLKPMPCDPEPVLGDDTVTVRSASARDEYDGDSCMDAPGVRHAQFGDDKARAFPLLFKALQEGGL